MLVLVQFPFADLRPFLLTESNGVVGANWKLPPDPEAPDFIRGFGQLRKRFGLSRDASAGWPSEAWFARAGEAIRFPDPIEDQFTALKDGTLRLRHAVRRVFSDGMTLWRLEIGLAFDLNRALSYEEVMRIVWEFLQLPVKVRVRGEMSTGLRLIDQRNRIAEALEVSTTYKKSPSPNTPQKLLLGRPMVLVETNLPDNARVSESIAMVPDTKHLVLTAADAANRVDIDYATLRFAGTEGPIVWLHSSANNRSEFVTAARVHLCRLHAEREVLTQILRASDRGKIDRANPLLEKYFSRAQQNLFSDHRFGIDQSRLREIFDVYDQISPGERSALDRVLGTKLQSRQRVANLADSYRELDGRVVIVVSEGGNFQMTNNTTNVGTNIGVINVGGTFTNNGSILSQLSNSDLKQALDSLNRLSKELADNLPDDGDKQSVALAAETIVKQATAAKPNKSMLTVTGKGLIDAAKTVAKMAGPITTAVEAVLALIV